MRVFTKPYGPIIMIHFCVLPNNYLFLEKIFSFQINTVFDHLHVTSNFNGYVFFLEEDHYVSPDFVHVAKKLIALKREKYQDCEFVNLGTYRKENGALSSEVRYT